MNSDENHDRRDPRGSEENEPWWQAQIHLSQSSPQWWQSDQSTPKRSLPLVQYSSDRRLKGFGIALIVIGAMNAFATSGLEPGAALLVALGGLAILLIGRSRASKRPTKTPVEYWMTEGFHHLASPGGEALYVRLFAAQYSNILHSMFGRETRTFQIIWPEPGGLWFYTAFAWVAGYWMPPIYPEHDLLRLWQKSGAKPQDFPCPTNRVFQATHRQWAREILYSTPYSFDSDGVLCGSNEELEEVRPSDVGWELLGPDIAAIAKNAQVIEGVGIPLLGPEMVVAMHEARWIHGLGTPDPNSRNPWGFDEEVMRKAMAETYFDEVGALKTGTLRPLSLEDARRWSICLTFDSMIRCAQNFDGAAHSDTLSTIQRMRDTIEDGDWPEPADFQAVGTYVSETYLKSWWQGLRVEDL